MFHSGYTRFLRVVVIAASVLGLPRVASAQMRLEVLHPAPLHGTSAGVSRLIRATDGNFYGASSAAGDGSDRGTIFRMMPNGAITVLHTFVDPSEGSDPEGPLVQASDGNFYGTLSQGGLYSRGAAFKMTPDGTVTILHSFPADEAGYSLSALIQASDGNFYGTANQGGQFGIGTIYRMTPDGTVTTLYSFTGGSDGCYPVRAATSGERRKALWLHVVLRCVGR